MRDGRRLDRWTSLQLTVAEAGSGRARARVTAGAEPHHFAFGRDVLWVSDNGSGALLRVGLRSRRVLGRTPVGAAPHHVAVAGSQLLVTINGTGRAAVLPRAGAGAGRFLSGSGPHGFAIVASDRYGFFPFRPVTVTASTLLARVVAPSA